MAAAALVLRDIHQPDAPAWWPPAPGWWLLAGALLVLALAAGWWQRRRRKRQRLVAALFDDALAQADSQPARVAAMSELLRRAARRCDPAADKLQGEAWLSFLDADDRHAGFTRGPGRLLLDGGFRRELAPHDVQALEALARRRFLAWMGQRP